MVSMVIILFLVAVLVSLFVGRIAEILIQKMRDRAAEQALQGQPLPAPRRALSRKAG